MMTDTAQHEPRYRVLMVRETVQATAYPRQIDSAPTTEMVSKLYGEGTSAPAMAKMYDISITKINEFISPAARANRRRVRKGKAAARFAGLSERVRAKMNHGTKTTYRNGCRCDECMTVKSMDNHHQRQRRLRLAEGKI